MIDTKYLCSQVLPMTHSKSIEKMIAMYLLFLKLQTKSLDSNEARQYVLPTE